MVKDKPTPETVEFNDIFTVPSKYWKTTFTTNDWLELYDAHGIAFKVTNKFVNDFTDKNYEVSSAAFQKVREDLKLDTHLNWGFNRGYVSGYALLYLGFRDNGEYSDPMVGTQVPDYVSVIPQSWVEIDIKDPANKNKEHYKIYGSNGAQSFLMHESRVIRLELREDSQSMLKPAYRSLFVADNVLWSTGQAIFRQAAGLTHLQISNPKTVELDGKSVTEVQYIKQKGIINNINSETGYVSDDRHKFNVHGVEGTLAKPKEYWEIALQAAAMALNVPWQLVIGANAGAVTGSETNLKDYYGMVQDYRSRIMNDVLIELAARFGFGKISVEFGTLFEETATERTDMFDKTVNALDKAIKVGLISDQSALEALNKDFPRYDFKLGTPLLVPTATVTKNVDTAIGNGIIAPHMLSFYKEYYTLEQAVEWAQAKGYTIAATSTSDYYYELTIRPKSDFVPGSYSYEFFEQGVELLTGELLAIKTDAEEFKSKWEAQKYQNFEKRYADALLNAMYDNIINDFNLYPQLKGSVQFLDSLKALKVVREDVTADGAIEANLIIESKTAKFREEARLASSAMVNEGWGLGLTLANKELLDKLNEPIVITERAQQLLEAQRVNSMSLVTGASDSMRKDLSFALNEALTNQEGPRQAAKAFKNYVDVAFANQYKNRLLTIARTETLRTLNQANVQAYRDSGVVDQIEWVTAGDDRVRPSHRAANGEVVDLGKQFSLGVTQPPEGILCRCSVVPKFDD
jgi:SPP1 gp7 family putative phage head morphogenesis protein